MNIMKPARILLYIAYICTLTGVLFYLLSIRFTGSEVDTVVVFIMSGVVSGGAVMMSVYGFSLYINRPAEKSLLFLGVFCVATAVRMLFLDGGPGTFLFPELPITAALAFRSISSLVAGLFHFYLILSLFGRKHVKILCISITMWMVLISATNNILSLVGTPLGNIFAIIAVVPLLSCGAIVIFLSGQMHLLINRVYFAATVISIFSSSLLMLGISNFAVTWNFIYLIVNMLLMADRYAKAIDRVEQMNENLEIAVFERTSDLREANKRITESEKQLKDLVANISHDLKTPLTVVGLNLERLIDPEQRRSEDDMRRMASVAYNKTLDLQRLTRNLFDAVRMEEGRVSYNLTWFKLSDLLEEVNRRYSDYAESNGVTLAVRYGEDLELWVDQEKIWSIFDNVINNSLRHTGEGGSIIIHAERESESKAILTISDTGEGIDDKHIPHIFERYYKTDPSRGEKSGDSGLGLYIVKSLVDGMGGSVSANSKKGEGTSINVILNAR